MGRAVSTQCNAMFIRNNFKHKMREFHNICTSALPNKSLIRQIQKDLKTKQRSAVEITQEWLNNLKSNESNLNSFLTYNEESAIKQANKIDEKIKNGDELDPMAGIPIAIKDNICTKDIITTAGSKFLENYIPKYNATVIDKLEASGAIIIGKTNLDEFGMGSSTESSAYKITKNPWDLERVPGGSSGGSAAAIAGNQCVAALGSDTGGSVRQPAHFCGIVGLKPSYGRVSRYGLIAYASSFDVIGPLTQTVEDAAIVLNCISGHCKYDGTTENTAVPDYTADLTACENFEEKPLNGKKIGIISETMGEGVDPEVLKTINNAIRHLESLGAMTEEVSISRFSIALPSYYILAFCEASSNLSRYDGVRYGNRLNGSNITEMYQKTRSETLGSEVKRRIFMGTYALSAGYYDAYYKRALKVKSLVSNELNNALNKYDVLITPPAPTTACKLGTYESDPLSMYKGDLMLVCCNLSGIPSIVTKCGYVKSEEDKLLPVGIQFIGRKFGELDLIKIAHIFEQTNPDIQNNGLKS